MYNFKIKGGENFEMLDIFSTTQMQAEIGIQTNLTSKCEVQTVGKLKGEVQNSPRAFGKERVLAERPEVIRAQMKMEEGKKGLVPEWEPPSVWSGEKNWEVIQWLR